MSKRDVTTIALERARRWIVEITERTTPLERPRFVGQLERRGCRYELSGKRAHVRDFDFCGRETVDGTWCAEHKAIVYRGRE